MKFVSYMDGTEAVAGVVSEQGNVIIPLAKSVESILGNKDFPMSMFEGLQLGEQFIDTVTKIVESVRDKGLEKKLGVPFESVQLLAPIPRPRKNIFCVGKNYADHAIEMGSKDDIPKDVMIFTKAPTSVTGHGSEILNHMELTTELDYEGELAVVIGKQGRGIKREEAMDFVFGYTIINDLTARDLQARHKQFFIGKSLDTTCPMGPWIVHKSLIERPNELDIQTLVNGEVRQKSNTKEFIFSIEQIIEVLSKGMTLEPGDIIATGTPAGVGKGFKPPRYLKPGDIMEVTIEKIGTLMNVIQK